MFSNVSPSVLLALVLAALIVYVIHKRKREKIMSDIIMSAFCDAAVRSLNDDLSSLPRSIPISGVKAFTKTMRKQYPDVEVDVGRASVNLWAGKAVKVLYIESE